MPEPKYKIVRHRWYFSFVIQDSRSGHFTIYSRSNPTNLLPTLRKLLEGTKKRHEYRWSRRKWPQQPAWEPNAPTPTIARVYSTGVTTVIQ